MESSKIICPHCGSHNCFHEEVDENTTTYLCMGCGYTSNDLFKIGSEELAGYEVSMPELYKDIKFLDQERGITWYPTVLNVPTIGLVFVDGTSKEDWTWKAAPAVDVPDQDREKYPIPGKPGEFYTKRIAMDLAKSFSKTEFTDACKYIGLIKEAE
jgi:DNA-directed RNA polymerase subunit RPC12/RpoP